jgi:hypothetical protein
MSRTTKKTDPKPPTRYLSVSSDPGDTVCHACNGVGTLRIGPGYYQPCGANGCVGGKVPARGELPRLWRVIGWDGCPECADTPDVEVALACYRAHADGSTARLETPVWDGDEGVFTTLSATYPPRCKLGERVNAYSIGHGRSFRGIVTGLANNGAFVKTEGRPDGDGPTFYLSHHLSPSV